MVVRPRSAHQVSPRVWGRPEFRVGSGPRPDVNSLRYGHDVNMSEMTYSTPSTFPGDQSASEPPDEPRDESRNEPPRDGPTDPPSGPPNEPPRYPPPPGNWTPPPGGWPPPGSNPPPIRQLRRSSTDRVAAGVSGGLGEYFGLDPVIFRVLFATTAFFGVGVVAYLFAWIVIPERGATNPPIDRFVAELRRRHVPLWLVITVGLLIAWAAVASWWSPRPLIPIALAAIVLAFAFSRSRRNATRTPAPVGYPSDPGATTPMPTQMPGDLTAPADAPLGYEARPGYDGPARQRSEFSAWVSEARDARRLRRQRNLPVRIATWSVWVVAIATLSVIDAVHRIPMPVYLWTSLAIVVISLAVGAILRRRAFGYSAALVPLAILLFALGGTSASFHDGAGDYTYTPSSTADLQSHYRTAFGRTTLDLRQLPTTTEAQTIHITQAAGQVRILVPSDQHVEVVSKVHAGSIELDHADDRGGVNFNQTNRLNINAGPALTIDVELADGQVSIQNVG
jgi:phage shock protein PspC (stress-responsive transcriptional regulator)